MSPEGEELLDQIETNLGAIVDYPNSAMVNDVFEAYLMFLIVDAAQSEGGNVDFKNRLDNTVSNLKFRTGPSSIYTETPYTHAEISFPNCPLLEAHIGIYVAGGSSVVHECDVAVITENEGRNCRRNNCHPRASTLLIGVECKYYTTNLGINLIRSFLGLADELSRKNRYFISNSGGSNPEKILKKHVKEWSTCLSASNLEESNRIKYSFASVFHKYKV